MLLGVQYHSSFYTINDSIVHFSYELRKKIYFKSISFFNHFVSFTDVCFLFLSFSFLLFSLSLILLAYLRVFLFFPSHIACNLFLFFVFFTLLSLERVFSIRSRPLSGDLFFDQYPHITNNQQIRKRNARGIIYSKFNGIVQHVSNGNVFPLNDI